ncbi:hypothetical protein ACA910_010623 [Epithemia clementina (nom. ined.)]
MVWKFVVDGNQHAKNADAMENHFELGRIGPSRSGVINKSLANEKEKSQEASCGRVIDENADNADDEGTHFYKTSGICSKQTTAFLVVMAIVVVLTQVTSFAADKATVMPVTYIQKNTAVDDADSMISIHTDSIDTKKSKTNYLLRNAGRLLSSQLKEPSSTRAPAAQHERQARKIDYSCKEASDCTVRQVGNCCGTFMECVNAEYIPDLKNPCDDEDEAIMCEWFGWFDIDECICHKDICVGTQVPLHIPIP